MKKMKKILIIVVVIIVVLALAKNFLIKAAVENGVRFATGVPLSIKGLSVGVFRPRVSIKDMRLHNPAGYQDKVMVDIPEIYVDYSPMSLLKNKVYVREVRFNLKQLVVVKNEKGETNINALKTAQKSKEPEKPAEKKPAKMPDIQIDNLELKVGSVLFKDYSKDPQNPSVKEFAVNIDEKYTDINNVNALVGLIMSRALFNTTVGRLADIDISGFTDAASQAMGKAKDTALKAGTAVKEGAQKAAETTKETLKQTTDSLKGLFQRE